MLRLAPILIAIAYGLVYWHFSAWRTARALDARSTVLRDSRLKAVTDRLARALDLPDIRVHVDEVPVLNGLAAPDGRIFLTRGFLDRYDAGQVSAEELASVIAHELGHVALGHSRRRMIDFSGQNAVRVVLTAVLGRLLPGLGLWLANALVGLLAAGLSRQDEYEADEYAAALLTKAGIGTEPQKALLRRLDTLTGSRGAPPVWLASHPPTPDRVRAIETLESRWRQQ
ncbi:MAG: M48 family metallopeptidase [Rhodobacter sp.]|uniref:M48 family metallopeptidase n=1 Tax=Pararhodobacter sp. TaxID=2127056 RepID=UPI001DDE7031|nr:M48 family metallopeptidase [Pararhodobacter sp.]MCB1345437.1 M48 family metallopeptidase [Paracoccaceae bacterium]MCB1408550.1 M48 family metallopeptidase [Paracoccaceae bacterium]MCC0074042.1 M48 family metallopeptidase [Rhodobacter sp.]HPD91856.1 M48 family metallopeptidase [Pararhodobacter sp.]